MSCSPFDLRDYYLKELTDPQQRQVESHVKDCSACREELERLRLTQAALFSLRDEEIPQRIAFVSDPVFEPSGPPLVDRSLGIARTRLGFASAAMLSAALLISAFTWSSGRGPAAGLSSAEVDRRIQQAVYASEARQTVKTMGEMLIARGKIEPEDLERALELQRERGDKLGKILVDMG
jgi:anti-sigma factor RsiW